LLRQFYHMNILLRFAFLLFLSSFCNNILAQVPSTTTDPNKIYIINGNSTHFITLDDSTNLKTIAGNAILKQGNTKLYGDSVVLNERTKVVEVFGHVHINDADTVDTYADYVRYTGNDRIAYLKRNVKLTDGKATLLTNDLVYNLATGIADYKDGGKVINGNTTLTSKNATYYSDTKDVFFKQHVILKDPKYNIVTDSMRYNTELKVATIIAPTKIKTTDGKNINSKSGTYDLKTGVAQFYERTSISDSTFSTIADNTFIDDATGISILEGRAKYVDSINHIIVVGDYIESNRKTNSFLATRKPVVIIVKDKDSTYIAADTLFSGLRKNDVTTKKQFTKIDTLNNTQIISKTPAKDSIRYILGYAHVRIFNDSSQAVCDSMYYSTEDSVFRMFKNPVVWKDKNQITGDTMYLFTEKQQPKRIYIFNNAMVVNKANASMYNQGGGRTLNAYFKEGKIDYTRIKGSPAETIFYAQDKDSAYIGMNRASGDAVDVFFVKEEVNKIKYINGVDGILYPMNQIPGDKKTLKNFIWQEKLRPKNKLELFE
jgi:lipopolysaccharide export system protein LptA